MGKFLTQKERISTPADLKMPTDREIFEEMTDNDFSWFGHNMLTALYEAQEANDLWPIREYVESWYRTLHVRHQPGYEEAIRWAREQ